MKMLYVYADFDWLKETELIGELGYESLRGSDSYCFTFSDELLATPLTNSFYFHVVFSIFLVKPYSFNFAFCLPM